MNAVPLHVVRTLTSAQPSANDDAVLDEAMRVLGRELGDTCTSIGVNVDHGVATLTGTVDWPYQVGAAEHCVREVDGVQGVVNRLYDRRASLADRLQTAISVALGSAGGDHTWIEVHIQPDGTAIIYGMVRDRHAKAIADEAAARAGGRFRIENRLCVMHG